MPKLLGALLLWVAKRFRLDRWMSFSIETLLTGRSFQCYLRFPVVLRIRFQFSNQNKTSIVIITFQNAIATVVEILQGVKFLH